MDGNRSILALCCFKALPFFAELLKGVHDYGEGRCIFRCWMFAQRKWGFLPTCVVRSPVSWLAQNYESAFNMKMSSCRILPTMQVTKGLIHILFPLYFFLTIFNVYWLAVLPKHHKSVFKSCKNYQVKYYFMT